MSLDTLVEQRALRPAGLPRTQHLPRLDTRVLQAFQPVGLAAVRRTYDVRVHDRVYVPRTGPVIIAANHVGTLDGPLVVLTTGRPTYALAKDELFAGAVGKALTVGGQIPLHRDYADHGALRRAVHVIRSGHALAIFPEGMRDTGDCTRLKGGLAYLALVTGAPVVPCAFLGTRLAGAGRKAVPSPGSRLDVVYGRPISIPAVPWPRRRAQVAEVTALLRERLSAHVRDASRWTGVELPGPVDA